MIEFLIAISFILGVFGFSLFVIHFLTHQIDRLAKYVATKL